MRSTVLALIAAAVCVVPALADAGPAAHVPLPTLEAAPAPVVQVFAAAEHGSAAPGGSVPAPVADPAPANTSVVHRICGQSPTSVSPDMPVYRIAPKPIVPPVHAMITAGLVVVPEPSSVLAVMVGLTGMYGVYRKRRDR